MAMVILIVFMCLLVLGLLMVVKGLWGRRVDDHPICSACRYDLSGMKVDLRNVSKREGEACAECGADLGRKLGVIVGHRKKRKWMLGFGVMVLMVGLLGGGVIGGGVMKLSAAHKVKPTWLLVWEMKRPEYSFDVEGAKEELWARVFKANGLSREEWDLIVAGMFEMGEKVTGESDGGGELWGKIMYEAIMNQGLYPEDRERLKKLFIGLANDTQVQWQRSWGKCMRDFVPMYGRTHPKVMAGYADAILKLGEDAKIAWQGEWGQALLALHKEGLLNDEEKGRWAKMLLDGWRVEFPDVVNVDDMEGVQFKEVYGGSKDDRGWLGNGHPERYQYLLMAEKRRLVCDGEVLKEEEVEMKRGLMLMSKLTSSQPLIAYRDELAAVRGEEEEREVELGMKVEVELFSNVKTLAFKYELVSDGVKVKLGRETPVAKLVMDSEGARQVRENLVPSSQMRLMYKGSLSFGEPYVAGYTVRDGQLGNKKVLKSWSGASYAHHFYFVVAMNQGQLGKGDLRDLAMMGVDESFVGLGKINWPMCYQVVIKVGEEAYAQDIYVTSDGKGRLPAMMLGRYVLPHGVSAKQCDLILRPAPEYAQKVGMKEILGNEIVYEDVNVLMVSDDDIALVRENDVVDLKERAKKHLVEVGEYDSLEEVE
ncbi:hypothetical protein JD969_06865 [Planctomycetota bacterium]|nr:hypothetical protein JD969_06865 [Planctomycetota bacterium]